MGEFDLIARIRAEAPSNESIIVGIGDDCAVLRPSAECEWLVTTDMLLDGRHFRLGESTAAEVGYKCLAVNLSDIAAMAGTPRAAFVAVALPRGEAETIASGLVDGMRPLAERFRVALAGGDTNAWDGPLVVCVTLLGETPAGGSVRRSGASAGDSVFVTGPLGGSLLGRHLRPEPRIEEALRLVKSVVVRAMIDISDGLLADLGHILDESGGLGATLDESAIPIHADARSQAATDGRTPLDHALSDGEDFELCFIARPEDEARVRATLPGVARIGEVTTEPGMRVRSEDGSIRRVEPRGFDHLKPPVSDR